MKCSMYFAALAAMSLKLAVPGFGGEAAPPLILSDIRTLFDLQDAAANGDSEAVALQRQLLSQIGQRGLKDLRPDAATAAMIAGYVLSGGRPDLAEEFSRAKELDPSSKRLLEGAASYMRGDPGKAAEHWRLVEPGSLPLGIGGRVALAKAMLTNADANERERLFSLAIAMMPGTLVEESAIRRSAVSQAELGNADLFWRRTERYLRRFRNSPYAAEFMGEAVSRIVAFEAAHRPSGLPRFDAVVARLPPPQRRPVYLRLAREAAAHNLAGLMQFAARRLRENAGPGSVEVLQADLYESLHAVTGPDYDGAVGRLASIDGKLLPGDESRLLKSALDIARQIRAPSLLQEQPSAGVDTAALLSESAAALVARSRRAIGEATRLLEQSLQ